MVVFVPPYSCHKHRLGEISLMWSSVRPRHGSVGHFSEVSWNWNWMGAS